MFLKPSVGEGGSLILTSPAGKFGEDGAYTVVAEKNADYASRAPIHEVFHGLTSRSIQAPLGFMSSFGPYGA